MTKKINISRRQFLQNSALLTAASTVGAPFALDLFRMNLAAAATSGLTDYKALVCIYLAGGNDHSNMVLATDSNSWAGYMRARDTRDFTVPTTVTESIALFVPNTGTAPSVYPTPNVLSITNAKTLLSQPNRAFGLHPAMAHMQTLFANNRAAIVANVGPLTERLLSADDYRNSLKTKPLNLFSHSDQTAQWQTSQPNPLYGWGGRVAEQIIGNNTKANFTCVSASGNTMFLAGNNVNQYQINSNGTATSIQGMTNSSLFGVTVDTNGNPLKNIITPSPTNLFESDHAAVVQRSINARQDLTKAMIDSTGVDVASRTDATAYIDPQTGLPDPNGNPLADQLRTVARIISQHATLGANRQIFFVALGGFDTHTGQVVGHAKLMSQLAHGMSYIDRTLTTLGLGSSVTTFTASDFGRTFASNGKGTDHGWGAHHFVVGGAVKGGEIYGNFPPTGVASLLPATINGFVYPAITNLLDVGSGNTVPQVSVDQYAATMAKWFGLSGDATTGDMLTVFPNLNKFTPNLLGFL